MPRRIEIVPTADVVARVKQSVPPGTTVTVTCLPHHGIQKTMQTAVQLAGLGYDVVPHLAARTFESRMELSRTLTLCEDVGISDVFVIGGDRSAPVGPYSSSASLMQDIRDLSQDTFAIGVAGYSEGHPAAGGAQMLDSLLARQEAASYLVNQMCFSAIGVTSYIRLLHSEGILLPVWVGVAGVVPRTKLLLLAGKIGVGSSLKFLCKKPTVAGRLLSGDRYSPGSLIEDISGSPEVAGVHFYTFNHLEALGSGDACAPSKHPGRKIDNLSGAVRSLLRPTKGEHLEHF